MVAEAAVLDTNVVGGLVSGHSAQVASPVLLWSFVTRLSVWRVGWIDSGVSSTVVGPEPSIHHVPQGLSPVAEEDQVLDQGSERGVAQFADQLVSDC